ncbi:GFA family protein [Parahaliea mediterranea]|uniref:GFA family protein n=1 Tax=Parahaliea mediterranea TaxID=651086 RepID=UPI000E2FA7E6|nr:GFA family protein [Parahaliea mediterranea]
MDTQREGSCLCGAVRFRVRGDFEHFYLCHCSRCRKGSGSAHAANLFSASAQLQWLQGESRCRRFRLPGSRHERCFCEVCGSALPYALPHVDKNAEPNAQVSETLVVLPAGSLDDPLGQLPQAHLFEGARADWDQQLETLPGFDALPE